MTTDRDMKRLFKKERNKKTKRAPGDVLRALDHEIVLFVHALAVADARRDHLAATQAASGRESTTKDLKALICGFDK